MAQFVGLVILALACAWPQSAWAQAAEAKAPRGSVAAQLQLKFKLLRESISLSASLEQHNYSAWQKLSPELRNAYRKEALAMLSKSPEEQAKLLDTYSKLMQLPVAKQKAYLARAKWLRMVVASFSKADRAKLEKMTPEDRAKALLARKALLIRQGKLAAEIPASQPVKSTGRKTGK